MKKQIIIISIAIGILLPSNALAQQQATTAAQAGSEYVYIKKDALPPAILEKLENSGVVMEKVDDIFNTIEQFKGINPAEIGFAIDTIASSLSEQALVFSKTKVGKTLIFITVWKVIGMDMVYILIKTLYILFLVLFTFWAWKQSFRTKFVTQTRRVPWDKKGFPFWGKKEVVNVKKYDNIGAAYDNLFEGGQPDIDQKSMTGVTITIYMAFFFCLLMIALFSDWGI
jgi:hypothetical protein